MSPMGDTLDQVGGQVIAGGSQSPVNHHVGQRSSMPGKTQLPPLTSHNQEMAANSALQMMPVRLQNRGGATPEAISINDNAQVRKYESQLKTILFQSSLIAPIFSFILTSTFIYCLDSQTSSGWQKFGWQTEPDLYQRPHVLLKLVQRTQLADQASLNDARYEPQKQCGNGITIEWPDVQHGWIAQLASALSKCIPCEEPTAGVSGQ